MSRFDCKNKLYKNAEHKMILRHWIEQRHGWDYYLWNGFMWVRAGNQLYCEHSCNYYCKLIGINLSNTGL